MSSNCMESLLLTSTNLAPSSDTTRTFLVLRGPEYIGITWRKDYSQAYEKPPSFPVSCAYATAIRLFKLLQN